MCILYIIQNQLWKSSFVIFTWYHYWLDLFIPFIKKCALKHGHETVAFKIWRNSSIQNMEATVTLNGLISYDWDEQYIKQMIGCYFDFRCITCIILNISLEISFKYWFLYDPIINMGLFMLTFHQSLCLRSWQWNPMRELTPVKDHLGWDPTWSSLNVLLVYLWTLWVNPMRNLSAVKTIEINSIWPS